MVTAGYGFLFALLATMATVISIAESVSRRLNRREGNDARSPLR